MKEKITSETMQPGGIIFTENVYKKIAEDLWDILDDIDSLPDMIHPNTPEGHEKCWKMMVKRAEKRHELLKSDGYTLSLHQENQ